MAKLSSMSKALSRKRNVQSALRWQKAVSQLGKAMASKLDLDAVLGEFAAGIKGCIPYDRVLICRVDPQSRIARLFLSSSSPKETLDHPADLYQRGETSIEWVVKERRPFVRDDTATQRKFETDERLNRIGFHSYVSLPLIFWGRVVGALHLAHKRPGVYGKRELAFLMSVTDWLAIAIENARFYRESQRLLEEQGVLHEFACQMATLDLGPLLQRLADEVADLYQADCALVWLRDASGLLRLHASVGAKRGALEGLAPENNGRSSWIVEKQEPLFIRDLRAQEPSDPQQADLRRKGIRSYLGVPIVLKDEGIGTLEILSTSVRDFSVRDIFFLQRIAEEAAVAIHRARLFGEVERLNQQLNEATQNKTQFLARLTHEIRTPLNVITGMADLMKMGAVGSLTDEQSSALEKIEGQAGVIVRMINEVLNLSRIEAGKMPLEISTFSMDRLIEPLRTLTDELQRKTGLRAVWDIDPDLPPITTDASKLEEILQNLIVNAFKYTPQGEVRISFKNHPDSRSIELAVEDTGKGVPAEDLPKIFQGFHQVHSTATSQGVGLGLAIVKKYLELLRGEIRVRSEVGKGSAFTVTLPHKLEA